MAVLLPLYIMSKILSDNITNSCNIRHKIYTVIMMKFLVIFGKIAKFYQVNLKLHT